MLPMLSIFGQLETFIADDLYAYRYVVTPILALGAVAAVALAYRAGVHRVFRRHPAASALIGAPLLVVAIVAGNYLVSPLWERTHLVEASPLTSISEPAMAPASTASGDAMTAASSPQSAAPTQARATQRGSFGGADDFHFGRGKAVLISTGDGKQVLRFEDFSVRNGPDLYVYLSKDPTGRRVEESLNLGRLKATDGAFNYEVPASIDLRRVESVVVWCKQFGVLFAVAPLAGS